MTFIGIFVKNNIYYLLFIVYCLSFTAHCFCEDFTNYLADGKKMYEESNYKGAMDNFIQVLAQEPENDEAIKYIELSVEKMLAPQKKIILKEREMIYKLAKGMFDKKAKVFDLDMEYFKALDYQKKKWYIKAQYGFRTIDYKLADYRDVGLRMKKIDEQIVNMLKPGKALDIKSQSYAIGYGAFFNNDLKTALNEWKKCLELDPINEELQEFCKLTDDMLKEIEKNAELIKLREMEEERKIKLLENLKIELDIAEDNFRTNSISQSVRIYESVLDKIRPETDERFKESKEFAMTGIDNSFIEIKKMIEVSKETKPPEEIKPALETAEVTEKESVDEAKSEEYYVNGLVAYSHGRIEDAVKEWEFSVRHNPGNIKSLKAKEKAEMELKMVNK